MAPQITLTTLNYQEQASRLLLVSGPTVAAHLQATRQALATSHNLNPTTPAGPSVCPSCGTTLIPGWNCSPSRLSALRKPTRQDRLDRNSGTKTRRIACPACANVHSFSSDKPASRPTRSSSSRENVRGGTARVTDAGPVPGTSAGGMEGTAGNRRRGRGKKVSLQSLVVGRKTAAGAKGLGLDLMDFVKG